MVMWELKDICKASNTWAQVDMHFVGFDFLIFREKMFGDKMKFQWHNLKQAWLGIQKVMELLNLLSEEPRNERDKENLFPWSFFKKYLFIYLAVPGLSCGTWDLQLRHANS